MSTTNINPIPKSSTVMQSHIPTIIPTTNFHKTINPNNNLYPNSEQITPCTCDPNTLIIESKAITDEMLQNIGSKVIK
jgi:hypothetical protein